MPVAKMKIVFSAIGVVLCFNSVCPVTSYVYDDSLYSKVNTMSFTKYGSVIKKRYTGNDLSSKSDTRAANHVRNGRSQGLKNSVFVYGPVHNVNSEARQKQQIDQAFTTPEMTPERNRQQEERQRYENNGNMASIQNQQEGNDRNMNTQETPNRVTYSDNYQNNYRDHQEKENSFVKRSGTHKERYEMYKVKDINVNKLLHGAEYQTKHNKINGDHYNNIASLTLKTVSNHFRLPPAVKPMQRADKYADRNTPLMYYKILNDMSRRLPETKNKKYDSKKREVKNANKDNIIKYLNKEDVKNRLKAAEPTANIDSSEETASTRANDMPYAVFYRMNPVSLDYQDEIIVDAIDENGDTYKGKSVTPDDELLVSNHEPQQGTVRLHKKIKNFSFFKKL